MQVDLNQLRRNDHTNTLIVSFFRVHKRLGIPDSHRSEAGQTGTDIMPIPSDYAARGPGLLSVAHTNFIGEAGGAWQLTYQPIMPAHSDVCPPRLVGSRVYQIPSGTITPVNRGLNLRRML